jgi:threonine aldolase
VKTTAAVSFASDNHAGVHPEAMEAIARANVGHAPAYGEDAWTRELEERCREVFGDVAVFPVFNGTGANVTSLAALLRPHQSVICAETAHLNVDECGAPERFAGCKLVDLPTPDGKLTPDIVDRGLVAIGDEHHVQARVVTVTQATELGTVYTVDELRRLTDHAHRNGLLVHMDGSRIANAAAALDAGLAEVTGGAGVDVLSFGGTKNGLLAAEAVVFFDRSLATDFLYVRKQAMQLSSKMRFASAQLLAMLDNELWRRNAAHANAMAQRLAAGLAGIAGVELAQPVQANGVFAQLPRAAVAPLQERYPFYVIDEDAVIARFMCSWDTRPEDVDDFLGAIAAAVA